MFIEHIGIPYKRFAVLQIEFFHIAVEIIQAEAGQDTPADTVTRHLLAAVNVVDPQLGLGVQPVGGEPRLYAGVGRRIGVAADIGIAAQRNMAVLMAADQAHGLCGDQLHAVVPIVFPADDGDRDLIPLQHPEDMFALVGGDLDVDMGIILGILFDDGREPVTGKMRVGPQIQGSADIVLAGRHIFFQHPAVLQNRLGEGQDAFPGRGEDNAFFRAQKQLAFQFALHLLNSSGDAGLGHKELLADFRDVSGFVQFQQ